MKLIIECEWCSEIIERDLDSFSSFGELRCKHCGRDSHIVYNNVILLSQFKTLSKNEVHELKDYNDLSIYWHNGNFNAIMGMIVDRIRNNQWPAGEYDEDSF